MAPGVWDGFGKIEGGSRLPADPKDTSEQTGISADALYAELLQLAAHKPKRLQRRLEELRRQASASVTDREAELLLGAGSSGSSISAANSTFSVAAGNAGGGSGSVQGVLSPPLGMLGVVEREAQRGLRLGLVDGAAAQALLGGLCETYTALVSADGSSKRPHVQQVALASMYSFMLREAGRSASSSPWGTLQQAAARARSGGVDSLPPLPWAQAFGAACCRLPPKAFSAMHARLVNPAEPRPKQQEQGGREDVSPPPTPALGPEQQWSRRALPADGDASRSATPTSSGGGGGSSAACWEAMFGNVVAGESGGARADAAAAAAAAAVAGPPLPGQGPLEAGLGWGGQQAASGERGGGSSSAPEQEWSGEPEFEPREPQPATRPSGLKARMAAALRRSGSSGNGTAALRRSGSSGNGAGGLSSSSSSSFNPLPSGMPGEAVGAAESRGEGRGVQRVLSRRGSSTAMVDCGDLERGSSAGADAGGGGAAAGPSRIQGFGPEGPLASARGQANGGGGKEQVGGGWRGLRARGVLLSMRRPRSEPKIHSPAQEREDGEGRQADSEEQEEGVTPPPPPACRPPAPRPSASLPDLALAAGGSGGRGSDAKGCCNDDGLLFSGGQPATRGTGAKVRGLLRGPSRKGVYFSQD